MKLYHHNGTKAVIRNGYLHTAPSAQEFDVKTVFIGSGFLREEKGMAPNSVKYNLTRKDAAIDLSKNDADQNLYEVFLHAGPDSEYVEPIHLYVDREALTHLQTLVPTLVAGDQSEPESISEDTNQSSELVATEIDLGKGQGLDQEASAISTAKQEKAEKFRDMERRFSGSNATQPSENFRRGVITLVAGVMLISTPEIFTMMTDTVAQTGHHAAQSGALEHTVAGSMNQLAGSLETMVGVVGGMLQFMGITMFPLGLVRIYKASRGF